jgi:phosphoribosylanthranilate isomerase
MAVDIKICGVTRPEDAAAAAASGATYLGVVFASGPRVVTTAQARTVVSAAMGRPVLGVFGAQPVSEILRVRDAAGLDGAQLHGSLSVADAATLRAEGLLVWRVVRLAGAADLGLVSEAREAADAVLVEPRAARADGGAGVALDLSLAAAARARLAGARMVLAGGLTPETVARAIALVSPDVVDVSSGVETLPGIKDVRAISRFVEAVRGPSPVA